MIRASVIVFPGSNCDRDVKVALEKVTGAPVTMVWHGEAAIPASDVIVLPGGFSYGDYLRCGAMAAHSPIMRDVIAKAKAGTPVLGICNGFQILCEAGLLPGVLRPNRQLEFVCRDVRLRVEAARSPFTSRCRPGQELTIPVKHGEGSWYAPAELLARLEASGRIVLRYAEDCNGSVADVAAVTNETGSVMGLMPHPEHAVDPLTGSADGLSIFTSLAAAPVGA